MIETIVIAFLLYTGWRVLQWVGRTVRLIVHGLGLLVAACGPDLPSQAERDRAAIEQLLKEVGAAR